MNISLTKNRIHDVPASIPALAVNGVSHAYGNREALRDVSLTVPQARFTALLGLNGAGKTTLFSLITRLYDTQKGSIDVLGFRVSRQPGEALRRLGVVFQARTLDLDLSVMENLLYHAALHGIGGREARRRAQAALQDIDLLDRARDPARKLSGGQMRRVEIARALLHEPRVLVLDEPTVGLDVVSKTVIVRHVRSLVQERRVAVLWATHLLDEVTQDDAVVVLHRGRVVAAGDVSTVTRSAGAIDMRTAFTALTGGAGDPSALTGGAGDQSALTGGAGDQSE
jgi:ABC-2 type transport system ATP-binding protein